MLGILESPNRPWDYFGVFVVLLCGCTLYYMVVGAWTYYGGFAWVVQRLGFLRGILHLRDVVSLRDVGGSSRVCSCWVFRGRALRLICGKLSVDLG